jgi:hypothetical protein
MGTGNLTHQIYIIIGYIGFTYFCSLFHFHFQPSAKLFRIKPGKIYSGRFPDPAGFLPGKLAFAFFLLHGS